jgi:hypothetical protein
MSSLNSALALPLYGHERPKLAFEMSDRFGSRLRENSEAPKAAPNFEAYGLARAGTIAKCRPSSVVAELPMDFVCEN